MKYSFAFEVVGADIVLTTLVLWLASIGAVTVFYLAFFVSGISPYFIVYGSVTLAALLCLMTRALLDRFRELGMSHWRHYWMLFSHHRLSIQPMHYNIELRDELIAWLDKNCGYDAVFQNIDNSVHFRSSSIAVLFRLQWLNIVVPETRDK